MNKEKQRIKIAEVRGMIGPFTNSEEWFEDGDNFGWKIVLRDATGKLVPDYLNDLNAMREATMARLQGYEENFFYELSNVVNGEVEPHLQDDMFSLVNATAAQKSEALLKVLNLWEDE